MSKKTKSQALETKLVHVGNQPFQQFGYVSPPIYRGSTALYENVEVLKQRMKEHNKNCFPLYGRMGTPNTRALENALSDLEGGQGAIITSNGLSAITTAIMSFIKSGDHLLVTDSVYWPTRHFCDSLRRFNIETEYYDPRIGSAIETKLRPNTRLVYMESPGSLTFEVQDVPAITTICRKQGVITLIDNTWATPIYFKPLQLGVDVSIHSGTKYITGHADSFLGVIIANPATYSHIEQEATNLGQCAGAEDVYLGLRGLRTLGVRLPEHGKRALALATWLQQRPEVLEVLYPALPESRDHQIWKRDFTGASGLLGFILKPEFRTEAAEAMVNALSIFGLGHSWGGFESLVIISDPSSFRRPESWKTRGPLIRIHVGFENLTDLMADLENGFEVLKHQNRQET